MAINAAVPRPAPAPAPTAPPPTKAAAATSRLAAVKKGRLKAPNRWVFYGPEGVGKSTLAANAPDPIWFDIEDGSGQLEVARYPFRDTEGGHVPLTYQDVLSGIDDLGLNDHAYKTLVIDTADRLESLLWKHMLQRDSGKPSPTNKNGKAFGSIEDYGYGKGYNMALDEWRAFCLRLDRLRMAKGMDIILLGHAQIKTFKNPIDDDYDRYQLRLNEKAAGFLKEWADVTGFLTFEDGAGKMAGDDRARPKGYSTGRRLLKLDRTAAFDAKCRLALPNEIEIDPMAPWAPLAAAVDSSNDPEKVIALIEAEVARIGDDTLGAKVKGAIESKKTDTEALNRYLQELRKRESAPSTTEPKEGASDE